MARRRSHHLRNTQRDDDSIASLLLEDRNDVDGAVARIFGTRHSLQEVEDLRQWHPEEEHRPLGVIASRAARALKLQTRQLGTKSSIVHARPQAIAVCARRAQRREVMFALHGSGRGVMSRRKHRRYTVKSRVNCR